MVKAIRTLLFLVAVFALLAPAPIGWSQPVIVSGVLQNPVLVNIFWDSNWDVDNPSMTEAQINDFTAAIVRSGYFSLLSSDFGMKSITFAGGFQADTRCDTLNNGTSPASIALVSVNPLDETVNTFMNCEAGLPYLPQGSNVIYNIFFAPRTTEKDLFIKNLCPSALAYHFHTLPDPLVYAAGPACLAGPEACASYVLGLMIAGRGALFTAIFSSPPCTPNFSSLTASLTEEIAEAITDPNPPLSVVTTGTGEIVDACGGATVPFFSANRQRWGLPPLGGGATASRYLSTSASRCVAGLATPPSPMIASVLPTGEGAFMALTIKGTGFGIPTGSVIPTAGNLPYLAVQNVTQHWEAGDSLDLDAIGLNVASWSDTTVLINGFPFQFTGQFGLVIKPNDLLVVSVCNPNSGNCTSTQVSTPAGAYLPGLNVNHINLPYGDKGLFNVLIDGKIVMSNVGNASTVVKNLSIGTHGVSVTAGQGTDLSNYKTTFGYACIQSGRVTLSRGEYTNCNVFNTNSSTTHPACPLPGQRCCETDDTGTRCTLCVRPPAVCP